MNTENPLVRCGQEGPCLCACYTLEGDLLFLRPLVFTAETVRSKGTCASLSCFEDVFPGGLPLAAVTNEVFCLSPGAFPSFSFPKCPMLLSRGAALGWVDVRVVSRAHRLRGPYAQDECRS